MIFELRVKHVHAPFELSKDSTTNIWPLLGVCTAEVPIEIYITEQKEKVRAIFNNVIFKLFKRQLEWLLWLHLYKVNLQCEKA